MAGTLFIGVAGIAFFLHSGREGREETGQETEETPEIYIVSETEAETEAEPETWTEAETEPYVSPVDFEGLWEVNPDVVGWITVKGTNIDYPIFHSEDNEKYLHTDREGNASTAGEIYLDCDDEGDFSSLHNVLYGHHMRNGSMFKDVVYFKEQDFFDAHQDIVIYTPEREIHLKPLAALYTSPDGIRRKTDFRLEEGFKKYVEMMTEGAMAGASPGEEIKRLYSLVTCSYEFENARTILYAYETEGTGSEKREFKKVEEEWKKRYNASLPGID